MTEAERRESRLILKAYHGDALLFVRKVFGVEPDEWQKQALIAYSKNQRLALKACKGPGKTCVLAWIIWHFLVTRAQCKVAATSVSADNLADNLWSELALWQGRSRLLQAQFQWTKTRIVHREFPETWFATARSWPKSADAQAQADTLAGLHADDILFVLDESSEIPQAVMATAEAVLAGGPRCKLAQAGNPTRLEGPLYRACGPDRALWSVVTATGDPLRADRSPRVSIEWAQQQIDTYGRDNPWVIVNVLGEFPPSSINSLLGIDEVESAMNTKIPAHLYDWSQKRLGIDVARFGDDRTVLFPRQGLMAFAPVTMRGARTTDIAARAAQAISKWGAEVTFVDDTGHWGHGVIDGLITAGYPNIIPVVYHAKAIDPRYVNRRAEMWMKMAEWVQAGGHLPRIPELVGELCTPTYSFIGGRFVIEDKDQIKSRLGRSPDLADALAQTFCLPDMTGPLAATQQRHRPQRAEIDFDPYEPRVIA